MIRPVLIFMILVLNSLFLVIPESEDRYRFFPLSDYTLSFQYYCYYIFQKLGWIVVTWMLYVKEEEYREVFFVFFAIQVFKFFEYFVNYNEVWFEISWMPVTSTTVGTLLLSISIFRAWKNYNL